MALPHKLPEMLREGVAVAARAAEHLTNRDAAVLAGMLDDEGGHLGQGREGHFFPFYFGGQAAHLLVQGAKEEQQLSSQSGATDWPSSSCSLPSWFSPVA